MLIYFSVPPKLCKKNADTVSSYEKLNEQVCNYILLFAQEFIYIIDVTRSLNFTFRKNKFQIKCRLNNFNAFIVEIGRFTSSLFYFGVLFLILSSFRQNLVKNHWTIKI